MGAADVLSLPSSQISMAGSTTMDVARSGKRAVAAYRRLSFCLSISWACRTFWTLVAKWPCQNQTMRSIS